MTKNVLYSSRKYPLLLLDLKLEISQQSIEKFSIVKFLENQHSGFGLTDGQTRWLY
jgi:hypothetical protein